MRKPLVSIFSLSLLWLLSPCELKAQRKPQANKQATPAASHAAASHAAATRMAGTFPETTRNHGYDTVHVSVGMTTYLIFPSPIKMLDLGSKNYAGRIEQNKLLLKPVRGFVPSSAMMIETEDGQVYLHYIAYRQQPERIFWDYRNQSQQTAARNEGSGPSMASGSQGNRTDPADPRQMYASKMAYLGKQRRRNLFSKRENNIGIRVTALAVDNTATYMLLQLNNRSSIPYKLEYVSFAYREKRKRKTRRNMVGEQNQVLPMFSRTVEIVKPRSRSELAYAFPLFANTLKGKLEIIVRETDGNRVVKAYVPAKVLAKSLYIPNSATAPATASTHK